MTGENKYLDVHYDWGSYVCFYSSHRNNGRLVSEKVSSAACLSLPVPERIDLVNDLFGSLFSKKKKEMTLDFRNVPVISFIRRQFQKVWWECDWESYCWRTDVDTSGQILAGVLQRTWVSDWCLPLSLLFWGMSYPFSDCFFICKVTFSPPFRPLPRLALNAVNKSPYKLKSAI